ncbi:hypothetical protein H9623_12865 [Oerskovia sp. Sa1BUA8]|uniref:Uncharacterized protein n=1 Tax=Oerskovia douganii TaxID=2762210 RepID=A0A9D5UAK7_9CELL|nr:hypothetical protein [Oerskovia douganii]MBE7701188.1 hypothetical protein [Oerskovia douganii]
MLAPYGGRVTPSSTENWQQASDTMGVTALREADKQLVEAYALLDTEQHARVVGYVGTDAPFARSRFVRTLDAVIVAGPEAVSRVVADPSALRSYDTLPVHEPYSEANLEAGSLAGQIAAAVARKGSPFVPRSIRVGQLDRRRGAQWPSRQDGSPDWRDPEVGWLFLDASPLCDAGTGENEDGPTSWYTAGSVAAGRIFRALHVVAGDGFDAQRPQHLRYVQVEIDLDEAEMTGDRGPFIAPGMEDASLVIDDEGVFLTTLVSTEDARLEEFDARVDLLTRHVAGTLAQPSIGFPPAELAILQRVAAAGV